MKPSKFPAKIYIKSVSCEFLLRYGSKRFPTGRYPVSFPCVVPDTVGRPVGIPLAQHHLSARHGKGLTGFAGLFDQIKHGFGHVFRTRALAHRNLSHVEGAYVFHRLGTRHLTGVQVLQEQAVFGVRPQRTFVEVARTYGIDLDAERSQLQRERLGETYAAEFTAGIGEVGFRAPQTRLGVDLDDVAEVVFGIFVLELHHARSGLSAVEVGVVGCAGWPCRPRSF